MKNCLMRVAVGCPFERCRGVEFGLLRALLGGIIAFHAKDDQYDKHMLKLGDTSVCCQNNIRIGEAWFRRCGQNVAMNRKCWNWFGILGSCRCCSVLRVFIDTQCEYWTFAWACGDSCATVHLCGVDCHGVPLSRRGSARVAAQHYVFLR